jgi:hypothetical protein
MRMSVDRRDHAALTREAGHFLWSSRRDLV